MENAPPQPGTTPASRDTDSDDKGLLEKIEEADVALSAEVGQHREHKMVKALGFLSDISDQPPAFTAASVAAVAGIVTGNPRLREGGLRALASLALATAAKAGVKAVVVRTRPYMLLEHGTYETGLMGPNDGPWNSFPSGHTANAFAAARAVSRVMPQAQPALLTGAAAIGVVQGPRAAHHSLDVVAGALVGLAAEAVVNIAFGALTDARARREAGQARPFQRRDDHPGPDSREGRSRPR